MDFIGFCEYLKESIKMTIRAEYPYDRYNLYVVFHKGEGRRYAQLVNPEIRGDRTTISYARYLMSVKEKRILQDWEHVDHRNNVKHDDRIENLQILTQKENSEKYILDNNIKPTVIKLRCENCGIIFERESRNVKKGNKFSFCSRKCNGQYYRKNGNNLNKKDNNHGVNMYRSGCRCVVCKKANSDRTRKYRASKK